MSVIRISSWGCFIQSIKDLHTWFLSDFVLWLMTLFFRCSHLQKMLNLLAFHLRLLSYLCFCNPGITFFHYEQFGNAVTESNIPSFSQFWSIGAMQCLVLWNAWQAIVEIEKQLSILGHTKKIEWYDTSNRKHKLLWLAFAAKGRLMWFQKLF